MYWYVILISSHLITNKNKLIEAFFLWIACSYSGHAKLGYLWDFSYCTWTFGTIFLEIESIWTLLWVKKCMHRQECQVIHAKSLQSCLTLCNPMNCSSPGSSVHGILQARILEWAVVSYSTGASQPRDLTRLSYVSCIGSWALYH